jgi:hypothetical protein
MRTPNYARYSSDLKCCSVRCPQRTALRAAKSNVKSAETADATALFLRASRAIDADDFSGERPVFCASDETGADGVLEHVVPFRAVTLVAAQEVIMEAGLPERRQLLAAHAHALRTGSGEHLIQVSLQSFDPITQSDFASGAETDKKVHMVGHDDVTPDTDTEVYASTAIIDKRIVQRRVAKDRLPPVRIERHEKNGRIEALEDRLQTRWFAFDHSLHSKCCSVRCPQRTSSYEGRRVTNSAETADTTARSAETADATARSAETADATARSAETADATARSAEDSGRYSTSPDRAVRRRFA